jgi:hypothetical protein
MATPPKRRLEAWAQGLIVLASGLLQEQRERYLEEWYALLEEAPTPIAKLRRALSLYLGAIRMAREASWQRGTSYAVPLVIQRAPGQWLMRLSRAVLPKRIYDRVVLPLMGDWQYKYFHILKTLGARMPLRIKICMYADLAIIWIGNVLGSLLR